MPEAVLNNLDAQMAAGSRLREEKAAAEADNAPPLKGGGSFRERVMAARQAMDLKERAKKKIEEKIMAPAKQGINWLLRWAWGTLIPSFGLTLIYINMHIFLRQVFPDAFCKLGEEWMPKMTLGENSAKNVAGTAFGLAEIIGLLLLDLVAIFIIMGVLALISMIITWATNPAEALKAIWSLGWTGVSALVDLFKGLLSYLF